MGPIGPDDPRLFSHFKNQGTSSTDAIQFWGVVGLEGDLLRPGSPLHDVDIVVMGGAWQTTAGPPPPSCGLPLSLFLLARWNFRPREVPFCILALPSNFTSHGCHSATSPATTRGMESICQLMPTLIFMDRHFMSAE